MSPKKDKSVGKNGGSKEIPGIFSEIKIDVSALDGQYNKGNTISCDSFRPYTIFGECRWNEPRIRRPGGGTFDRSDLYGKIF